MSGTSAAQKAFCDQGRLDSNYCNVTSQPDITGANYTDKTANIIVKGIDSGNRGRLYTEPVNPNQNDPVTANIETSGDFIVKRGGAVHANINISAVNIKVEPGGIMDASGLGYQAVPGKKSNCPTVEAQSGFCTGFGPAGGGGGGSNSGTGAGGGGHGGKGGSYDDSGNSYASSGGGRGPVKSSTYGTAEEPASFGSAGGSFGQTPPNTFFLDEAASYTSTKANIGNAFQYGSQRGEAIKNASDGFEFNGRLGKRDDPSHDLADSDRWHPTDRQYRANNPNTITMGAGGGRIRLVANNKLNNSGYILSNGLDGMGTGNNGYPGAAGAGGSISIAVGGVFGDGVVRAEGGDYAEFMDGGESNTGKSGVSAGGGGGRIYYAFSISRQTWDISAEAGQGTVGLDTDFSGNSNKQNSGSRDLTATDGSVVSQIAFAANVNETLVNPGETVKVNGTASSTVEINISGDTVGTAEPNSDNGSYTTTVDALDIQNTEDLGNYTMSVSSTISRNTITSTFNISHRTVDIEQNSEYIFKPGGQFENTAFLDLVKQDGSGGSTRETYAQKGATFRQFSGDTVVKQVPKTTSTVGIFTSDGTITPSRDRKFYTTRTENSNGIKGFDRKNLSWVDVNDTVVDPGQAIKINGSAHDTVSFELERPDGSFIDKGAVEPNPNGYFAVDIQSLNRSVIDSEADLGAYNLRVKTPLNGQVRTETFEISHREVEINNQPDFILKPGEDLGFPDFAQLISEDGLGGSRRVAYSGETLSFNYFNGSENLNSSFPVPTNATGGYSVSQQVEPTPGLKRFTLETENANGIDDTLGDNDIQDTNNRTIAWAGINDSVVDPGQEIQINGSAYNTVEILLETPSGGLVSRNPVEPGPNGYFEADRQVLTRSVLDSRSDLGNYTLRLRTVLNGETRTEDFELSYREIEYQHSTDFLLRPGEQFTVAGSAERTLQDGSGGSRTIPFANREFNFLYFNGSTQLRDSTEPTDGSGQLSVTDTVPPEEGLKFYVIEDVNENGITDLRSDNDLRNTARKNLSTASIDDFIVNSGEEIKVNGTAHRPVEVSFNGTEVPGSPVTPDPDTGFYNITFDVTELGSTAGLGNQTIRVNTSVNGEERSEAFEVSLRGIRFSLDTGYPRRVDPGQNFTISGTAQKFVADGSGGSTAENYTGEQITATYTDTNGRIQQKSTTTDTEGGFSITDLKSPLNAGNRRIELSTVNDEGIRQERSETVKTRIRVQNGSTTSPSKRLFKDSALERTKFVNPTSEVDLAVDTRKSLDFVEEVYANVTLPDGARRQVELNAQNVLGTEVDSETDWDAGTTQHLTHFDALGGIDPDQLRIGYQSNPSDSLLLNMPMEKVSGQIRDISGKGNGADVLAPSSVSRGVDGVFSTRAIEFQGGTTPAKIQDSAALNLGSNFTVSTWIETSSDGAIYSRANNAGGDVNPELRVASGSAEMEISNSGTDTTVSSSTRIDDGQLHHVAGRYNGTHISIYVDGEKERSNLVNAEPPRFQAAPVIGDTATFLSRPFIGTVDGLKVFNQSLDDNRIEKLGSTRGAFTTETITTERSVRDILKIVNFRGDLNSQEVGVEVESDPDGDTVFEEKSETINLSDGTTIRSVTGLTNLSTRFRLSLNLTTSDPSSSPIVSRLDLKARKQPVIGWRNSKPIDSFFGRQYGNYSVDYGARDYGGNRQDTVLEESNFTVRDIEIDANHSNTVEPGNRFNITGNATLVTGDGSGGRSEQDFTGELNVLFENVLRGDNEVQESRTFANLGSGASRRIPVNGTVSPENTQITFFGRYSGVDESLNWSNATDWDGRQSRTGTTHSAKEDSSLGNSSLSLGYPSQDLGGTSLISYYAMDDSSAPLNDSAGSVDLQSSASPGLGSPGILSTEAVRFSGGEGFSSAQSPFESQGSFTINAWVQPDSLPSSQGGLSAESGSPYTVFAIEDRLTLQVVEGGDAYAETRVDGQSFVAETSAGNIQPGEWTMVTLVYNDQDDSLTVSTGQGADRSSVSLPSAPDLTSGSTFVGYRPDIGGNGFDGRIDELRLYGRPAIPFNLRDIAGDKSEQQQTTTGLKSFSETVRTESLVLEADIETNGQRAEVVVESEQGGTSDPIELSTDQTRYPVSGNLLDSQDYSLSIELDSNVTAAPVIEELRLIRRFATENPAVDTDGDGEDDASFTGRIIPGQSRTVQLSGLSTGVNQAGFSTRNGRFDAEINYTEILVTDNRPKVEIDSSGRFETNFTVPQISGSSEVEYFLTNPRGIQGINQTRLATSLLFTSTNTSDLENGDRVVDPQDRFQVNATLAPHDNPIALMQATIETPSGNTFQREMSKSGNPNDIWDFKESVQGVFDTEGNYTVSLSAEDTSGLEDLRQPQVSFNVTNGTASVERSDRTVGLGRRFTINGTVRQNLTGEAVNATVEATIPQTGETSTVTTDPSGDYVSTLQAPESTGTYEVVVTSEDSENITAANTTSIRVENTTSFGLEVPDTAFARDVTRFSDDNTVFTLNVTNRGDTEIRNMEIFLEDLPTTTEYDEAARKTIVFNWSSDIRQHNISANATEQVAAEVLATRESSNGLYRDVNLTSRFNTTAGVLKQKSRELDVEVTGNREPVFSENFSINSSEGFEGNLIPPDQQANNSIQNVGNVIANSVTWNVTDGRVKSWIESWEPERVPEERTLPPTVGFSGGDIPGFETLPIFQLNADIPEGTRPGNYTTTVRTSSENPTGTNEVNISVDIPTKSTYNFTLRPRKRGVQIPESEINLSNRVDLGPLATGDFEETALAIDLNNTGNRDLEWTLSTDPSTFGQSTNRIYFNTSSKGNLQSQVGLEDYTSEISPSEGFSFDIPDRRATMIYDISDSAQGDTYRFNLTIECRYPVGGTNTCRRGDVVIPMEGEVKDPKPRFFDLDVPNITAVDNTIYLSGGARDNSQVSDINITIEKNLDGPVQTETITDVDYDTFQQSFNESFTPTNEFDEGTADGQEPDEYSVVFEASDDVGQVTESREFNLEVKESASPTLTNISNVVLDNVTVDSPDSASFNGTVVGGDVTAENLTVEMPTLDNFVFSKPEVNLGDVGPGQTKSFDVQVTSTNNPSTLVTFEPTVRAFWRDPDGSARRSVETTQDTGTIDVRPTTIMEVDHGASRRVTVDHNTTETEKFTISSNGNTRLTNVQITPVQSFQNISVSGVNRTGGFSIPPGETETVAYNITVEKFTGQRERAIDLRVSHGSGTQFLNSTRVEVPEDRSISVKPDEFSAAIPVNRGNLNLTDVEVRNVGNAQLDLGMTSNTTRQKLFFGESQTSAATFGLGPGERKILEARTDTENLELGRQKYSATAEGDLPLDSADTVLLDLFAQDIDFDIRRQNRVTDIVTGDIITTRFNLTQRDSPVENGSDVDITLDTGSAQLDVTESYNESGFWTAEFEAPDIEDGVNHTFDFGVTSSAFRSELTSSIEVSYRDVTPPRFANLTAEPVESGENSTFEVVVSDNSDLQGGVAANVVTPSGDTEQAALEPQTQTGLSETESKRFAAEFNETLSDGVYNVTVTATDRPGNSGSSSPEFFRVFQPLNVSGDAGQPSESTEIRLIDQGGDTAEVVNPTGNRYNQTIKSGTYNEAQVVVTEQKAARLDSLTGRSINRSPPRFDARINDNLVDVDKEYLSGFAVVSETFENVSGQVSFDYSNQLSQVDFQGNLQVMKCGDYNISEATPCQSEYEVVNANDTFIDSSTSTLAVDDISGFSSYILVEDEASSENNNLNVNLTGELGGLGNLSDLSDLDSILQEVADNTAGSSGSEGSGGGGDSGGSGSGGGGGSGGQQEPLEQIASQLNESEEQQDLAVGNSRVSVTLQPGQQKSTAVSVQNPREEEVSLSVNATENIRQFTSFEQNLDLQPGEFRTVRVQVNAENVTELREYTGFLRLSGPETDRSIPFSIEVVSAEQRLLDVTLEPTVDSFAPGQQARLKLSFSNQGFSRAVDAVTEVSIEDIAGNETLARTTQTYAVQTTLDRIVELQVPEDADLGTYEASAQVEYANVPGNRSATAVAQVNIQRPFLQQRTLGVQNLYLVIAGFALVVAASGGGYWYYRKKKLEAKRSRFEEQVDNDAIPGESGRTAFLGELSEIGTRAFLNLDDLMTHCLTAGATGAGKSVAAQVIVEEALEQGVNVIVLDPTGQWSGYLDENEDDEFFAFYDDFGMKESDARSYEGNIRAVDAEQDTIDITDIMRPDGDEGSIHVFSMHKLENAELEEYLSDTIQQIFDYNPEEKDQLKTLICYDEAHRVLEKFGGTGRGVKMLERGAREFRKWGTGMLMISQVIEDFPEEVRANIGTQIQMRTEYEGDLDRIERKYGNNITQGVTKADTGTGMLQNSSYNHGRPYFVDFRPVKHSPERLSDEELDKFEKYNRRVDEIEDMIQILEDEGEDVFEYNSQLKLVKKNIRKRSFNLVDTYLDELEEDLNDELDI
jgi:hypothetical protein